MPRDWSIALTDKEIEDITTKFKSMPTFKPGGHIYSKDLIKFWEAIDYPRTQKQKDSAKRYVDKMYGGIVTTEFIIECAKRIHSSSSSALYAANQCDLDGDGFISAEEFIELMEAMKVHDPTLPQINFDQFVKEADSNKDGKISIDECAKWIEANFNS